MENKENNGNGQGVPEVAFKGAVIDVNELKREDGIMTRAAPQTQSLLHRVITAEKDNSSYRQELKTALFASSDEADEAVSALNECFVLSMDPTPIIDQIIARSAGKNHELLYEALHTLTHTSFTTNYQNQKGKNNSGYPRQSNSPIG